MKTDTKQLLSRSCIY